MRILYLWFLSVIFQSLLGWAQPINQLQPYTIEPGAEYLPKVVVFKVKPAYKSACTDSSIALPSLLAAIGEFGDYKLHRLFAGPAFEINDDADQTKQVDLTLVYQLEYKHEVPLEKAINQLLQTKVLAYAEPHYIYQSSYVPNDQRLNETSSYLNLIKAFDAWNISRGDTNVVIAIVDSGIDWDHPDLEGNIKKNFRDPIDGRDNDRDGYVDNFRGWDLAGADTARIRGDNNPMIMGANNIHGSHVSGIAGAVADNGLGIAGIGFKCKILPVKCAADNDMRANNRPGRIITGYEGIVYAANQGAHVINCSWGGSKSGFGQDAINYATFNKNALVVASAGNENTDLLSYPAAYDNVLAVAAVNNNDVRAPFSNYGSWVDLAAPGVDIYSTVWDNDFVRFSGTSMAAPVVSGAAALVKSRFPNYTARQIRAQLKATADDIAPLNPDFVQKLGKGRLNIYRALTEQSLAVQLQRYRFLDTNITRINTGDTANIIGSFINLLNPTTSAFRVSIGCASPYIKIIDTSATLGLMPTGSEKTNETQPFRFVVLPGAPVDERIVFTLRYADGAYQDIDQFSININPDYVNLTHNNISTTISNVGRIGWVGDQATTGLGFQFQKTQLLQEMGLIVGVSPTLVANTVRAAQGLDFDNDFKALEPIGPRVQPDTTARVFVGKFTDVKANPRLNLAITHVARAWNTPADLNYVVVEYYFVNKGTTVLNNLYAGLYADWDISPNGQNDRANWAPDQQLGYIFNLRPNGLYAGIALLNTDKPNYYAIDNAGLGTSINISNGFTKDEKFRAISSGMARTQAGTARLTGADVSHVVGAGPFSIAPDQETSVAFALVAGPSLTSLQQSVRAARNSYNNTLLTSTNNLKPSNLDLAIYPNPTYGQLYLYCQGMAINIEDVSICNTLGQTIPVPKQSISTGYMLDLQTLPQGIYMVKVSSQNQTLTKKIVLQR